MKRNPDHRRSIRLRGYDYSQAGAYFVTVCAKGRACLFGNAIITNTSSRKSGGRVMTQTAYMEHQVCARNPRGLCSNGGQ